MPQQPQLEGQVELETGITPREDGTIEVFYRVINDLDVPILLLTPLSRVMDNEVIAEPERVYAYVDPDGVLHVTKRSWPMPDAIDVYFPEVPYATRVESGASFEERLRLKLPVALEYPYRGTGQGGAAVVAEAQGFAYSIGYMVEELGGLNQGSRNGEDRATLVVSYGTTVRHQRILQGELLKVGVPVKDCKEG